MTIKKVLTYGCSFAYGDGVERNETFTHLLADKLGCEYVNQGINGSSNKRSVNQLMEDITQTKYSEYPELFVVFSWTGMQRTCFYNEEYKMWIPVLVGHTSPDPMIAQMNEMFYRFFYSEYESLYTLYQQQLFLQSFLNDRNIKYLFINAFREDYIMYDDQMLTALRENIAKEKFALGFHNSIYQHVCGYLKMLGPDGFHPNQEGHEYVATELLNHFKRIYK